MKFKHIFYIIAPKIRNEKMRNLIFLALFLTATIFFLPRGAQAESFITDEEYGAMLYKNPRGVGCRVEEGGGLRAGAGAGGA